MDEITGRYWPRQQFAPYHERTQRFAKIVAHRRAGKTVACINDLLKGAVLNERKVPAPRCGYVAPTYAQAKDVAWPYLKHYARPLITEARESDLIIELVNGSRIRLYGADNYDRMRGLYFDRLVIDEPAMMDPRAWPMVLRPALADFGGWVTFIGTPCGRDWFYSVDQLANGTPDPDWFRLTLKASETGILPETELADARKTLSEDQYAQEFECSFEAAIIGAYYGKLMTAAEADKRITNVPHDAAARVWTAWDLGYRDATAVWFAQVIGKAIHIIDYHESVNVDITDDVKAIQAKSYNYAGHILPHDAWATSKQTGATTADVMKRLGMRDVKQCPDHRVHDGITAAQVILPKCWFDQRKCSHGTEALRQYRAEYDAKRETLRPGPVHDWASHAADAFRYLAMGLDTKPTGSDRDIVYPKTGWQ